MLPGELLSGRNKDAETIENFCVSPIGGGIENDIRYFNQNKCKAVVTSGDRTDIHLAALDADAECLILTGHLYPSDIVLAKAEEKSVPVMVARDDTLKAMDKIRRLQEHFGIHAPSKVKEAIRIVQKNINFKAVYKKIGL
ncbi:MAG: hypothetical protein HY762_07120 [Planctomycetes bacterium]|nr:hypothetical protein [Planctomycetota bacterium]